MEYTVMRISDHGWQIKEYDDTMNVYMYLLTGRDRALLIDAGYGTIPLDRIVRELTDLPVTLVLTHGHFDHIGAAAAFSPAYIHEADETLARHHADMGDPAGRVSLFPKTWEMSLMVDDAGFDLGDRRVEVLPVPGHSLGCICLYDPADNLLYTGDTCCVGDVLLNLENAASPEVYLDSVHRLQHFMREKNITVTWPGHHACPVGPDVIEEFEEATSLLIRGELQPEWVQSPFGEARHVSYKRIGIWL